MKRIVLLGCSAAALVIGAADCFAEGFTINEALKQAILTNPGIGEAAANRRATESELRQTQSTLLPQVKLGYRTGPEKFNDTSVPPLAGNGQWHNGWDASVVARQIIFDGFSSIHDIWRQSARTNAAAFRVQERTELIALDAAEAYIDVVRYIRLVELAQTNVANHEKIFSNVNARFAGGRAGEGDLEQARERVENAKATLAEFRKSLEDARAKYRKVVGIEPINLRFPGPLRGLPTNKDEALAVTVRFNPTIRAATADADAAKHAFRMTDGAFVPSVALEAGAAKLDNTAPYFGVRHEDYSGKLVVSWDIFRGGQDVWRRTEMSERYTEAEMARSRLQRAALESIDQAWSARTVTVTRIEALSRQLVADRKSIAAFQKEYELGQRSLIDLLNAENQYFNAAVSLASSRGVLVFGDFQLLAAMGALTEYLKAPPPVDAAPLDTIPVAVFPYPLPSVRVNLPDAGSKPLRVDAAPIETSISDAYASTTSPAAPAGDANFRTRWPRWSTAPSMNGVWEWLTQNKTRDVAAPTIAFSDAGKPLSYVDGKKPNWLLSVFPVDGSPLR
jgi:outer membrane protein, adhesin transport system